MPLIAVTRTKSMGSRKDVDRDSITRERAILPEIGGSLLKIVIKFTRPAIGSVMFFQQFLLHQFLRCSLCSPAFLMPPLIDSIHTSSLIVIGPFQKWDGEVIIKIEAS